MDIRKAENAMAFRGRQLSVITTDLWEAEGLICRLAAEEKERLPQKFMGEAPCVYFKMPYVQPYETFKELRSLILRVRENTGLRAEFRGVVAVEVTQWLGHETEEYFMAVLKYMFDHGHIWNCVMVLNQATDLQIRRFLTACSQIITPRLTDVSVFSDGEVLSQLLDEYIHGNGAFIHRDGLSLLTEAVQQASKRITGSLSLLQRTVEDLMICLNEPEYIRAEDVQNYLQSDMSMLTMLTGKPLVAERKEK